MFTLVLSVLVLCASIPQTLGSVASVGLNASSALFTQPSEITVNPSAPPAVTCVGNKVAGEVDRAYTMAGLNTAIQTAVTLIIDNKPLPNPKNDGNLYPHAFKAVELPVPAGVCTTGKAGANGKVLYEFPIIPDSVFNAKSKTAGKDRVIFYFETGTKTTTYCQTAQKDPQGSYVPCTVA